MLIKFHSNLLPSPCINISSTTIELLEWIRIVSGIRTIKSKKNYNSTRHSDSYEYSVKYRDAILLLNSIEPYIVIKTKKNSARFILDFYEELTPRNGKYSENMLLANHKFYQDYIAS